MNRASPRVIPSVVQNIDAVHITINEDKLHLCLLDHMEGMVARKQVPAYTTALLTTIGTLATTSFQAKWGIPAESWRAIFVAVAFVIAFFLARAASKAWNAPTIPELLRRIKKQDDQQE